MARILPKQAFFARELVISAGFPFERPSVGEMLLYRKLNSSGSTNSLVSEIAVYQALKMNDR